VCVCARAHACVCAHACVRVHARAYSVYACTRECMSLCEPASFGRNVAMRSLTFSRWIDCPWIQSASFGLLLNLDTSTRSLNGTTVVINVYS